MKKKIRSYGFQKYALLAKIVDGVFSVFFFCRRSHKILFDHITSLSPAHILHESLNLNCFFPPLPPKTFPSAHAHAHTALSVLSFTDHHASSSKQSLWLALTSCGHLISPLDQRWSVTLYHCRRSLIIAFGVSFV